MVSKFDQVRSSLVLSKVNMIPILPEDVHLDYGLPIGGVPVTEQKLNFNLNENRKLNDFDEECKLFLQQ